MNETIKNALILIAVVAIIIIILYLLLVKKSSVSTPIPSPTSQPSPTPTPSSQPLPSSSPQPQPSPTPSPTPLPPVPIQVTSFVISNDCTGPYCWGMITFNSSITGTLTQVITVYSNGSTYSWYGSYTVNQGSNTIWLDDCDCNTLSCYPPGQITKLVFVINGNQYTVPVTPTVGNPLATTPPSQTQIFIGSSCPCASPSPSPSPSPTPSPTPTPSPSYPIQVTSFVISNDCTGPYCWGMITFNSSITGTLTQVTIVYSDGSLFCWTGLGYTVNQGSNTIWLDTNPPCTYLSCYPPGQITKLVFVINGNQYTVPVTPTVGNPLATTPPSQTQIFIGPNYPC